MDYNRLIKKKSEIPQEIVAILKDPFKCIPPIENAIEISLKYKLPLHPRYLFYWKEVKIAEFIEFLEGISNSIEIIITNNKLEKMITDDSFKRTFEILGVEHNYKNLQLEFNTINTQIFFVNLGLKLEEINQENVDKKIKEIIEICKENLNLDILDIINKIGFLEIRDKGGTYIGARMGRPEKAKMRKQFNDETRSHGLFPTGVGDITITKDLETGEDFKEVVQNRMKNLISSFKSGFVEEEFRIFVDPNTNEEFISPLHPITKEKLFPKHFERYTGKEITPQFILGKLSLVKPFLLNIKDEEVQDEIRKEIHKIEADLSDVNGNLIGDDLFDEIKIRVNVIGNKLKENNIDIIELKPIINAVNYKKIKLDLSLYEKELRLILGKNVEYPKHVKGITGSINKHHTTEHLSKGFLRALNGVFVNKDGTVRFDMIEMGMTHFKPKEIGTSIEKLKELGYTHDYLGQELVNENQICEMMPQDVALPDCSDSGDEFASYFIIQTAKYVDDLLEKLYGLERFYNFKTKEDTIGHLIIGLAPHTSAGIIGRIIGYTKTQGCFSHPVWHAAQRRNLDGDENGIMLLLDGLINFSREYLPDRRGSRTMDVSLVLTAHLYLDQIDDEVHGMDIVDHYPLELYRAAQNYESPKSIKIEKVEKRMEMNSNNKDDIYLGYHFTHSTGDMNETIMCSSYKSLPTMKEKLDAQLNLAEKIRAVDENKVGTLIIDKHFMKDIKGNLRKFGMQTFRCTNCNTKFRRPPLLGKCTNCGSSSVNFTISEGSVKKYVQHSFNIIEKYNVDPYIAESVELTNLRIEGVFGKEAETQKSLTSFFGK